MITERDRYDIAYRLAQTLIVEDIDPKDNAALKNLQVMAHAYNHGEIRIETYLTILRDVLDPVNRIPR